MFCRLFVVAALLGSATGGFAGELAGKPVREFLDAYCVSCHAGEKAKGGLRLDGPPADLATPTAAAAWENLLDRVEAREMPPRKSAQPDPAELRRFTAAVAADLTAAAVARRADRGRAPVRRLTRVEYEHTVRDIFGLDIDLKQYLPDDGHPGGFDTAADGLSVSAVHLERYLEAAAAATDAAFPDRPKPVAKNWKITCKPPNVRQPPESDFRLKTGLRELPDGTFVFFNSLHQHLIANQFAAPEDGRYRVRVTTSAVQSGGKPLTLALYAGSFDPRNFTARLIGHFEAPADKPRVIEFTERMPARGTIKPVAAGLGYREIGFNAAYDGPGVAVHGIEIDGPLVETWPPAVQTRLFGARDLKTGTPADAKPAFEKLLPSLFRRPVTADEVQFHVGFVKDRVAAGDPFPKAFRAAVRVALCSPDFLFLRPKASTLDGPELAARLSYLLWSSCPDDALTAAALRGDLADRENLRAQVDRMLADPKAARFRDQFVGQWLGLRQIEATVPDGKLYPEFDDHLLASMSKETLLFVGELLDRDLPVRNLVDSDWTFLDGRLARHYGIPGVDGLDFRKVPLKPEYHRGGVLTQASLLKVTANGSTTSPVVRGNWVLSAVLGRPIKRPPPDVPAIEPDTRGTTTVRQLLAKHRESAACAGCHNRIDPPGLALESYDPIGAYRTYFRTTAGGPKVEFKVDGRSVGHHKGPAVDPSGTLASGETFADLAGLKKSLLADERAVAANVAGKLIAYATGAAPGVADRAAVEAIVDRAKPSGYGFRTILHEVIASELFRTR